MIYHVTEKSSWEKALESGAYEASSLHAEGFIHMSKHEQITGVLERYYAGKTGLVLLHIDESRLQAALKYEWSPSVDQEFPHLFGPLNLDAVLTVELL